MLRDLKNKTKQNQTLAMLSAEVNFYQFKSPNKGFCTDCSQLTTPIFIKRSSYSFQLCNIFKYHTTITIEDPEQGPQHSKTGKASKRSLFLMVTMTFDVFLIWCHSTSQCTTKPHYVNKLAGHRRQHRFPVDFYEHYPLLSMTNDYYTNFVHCFHFIV